MGYLVQESELQDIYDSNKLLIRIRPNSEMIEKSISVNNLIAAELIRIKPERRSFKIESVFNKVIMNLPDKCIIRDIDVLFNPNYNIDVMKILVFVYKQKHFELLWGGSLQDDWLIYSHDGYKDYNVYDVKNYDVIVIK